MANVKIIFLDYHVDYLFAVHIHDVFVTCSITLSTGFPRYLMGGLYPPYPSLFSSPESLSLLGAGVACVPGGGACVSGGGAPSVQSAQHMAQCQRLLENMQKGYCVLYTFERHFFPIVKNKINA